ncbi:MAG: DUF429 domain-containing protein [Sandaracinaceae bacterium]
MRTLGIDLAAQAKGTYACVLEWSAGRARVERLEGALDDPSLLAVLTDESLNTIGVDVPFGWPAGFVELMAGRGAFRSWSRDAARLRLRATDHACKLISGKAPLSVSSDRIAAPAMRWRILRASVRCAVHEVYPAAALALWGLPHQAYKRPDQGEARRGILDAIRVAIDLDALSADAEVLVSSADALDALVASMVARAIALELVHAVPAEHAELATIEGWIRLPSCTPDALR